MYLKKKTTENNNNWSIIFSLLTSCVTSSEGQTNRMFFQPPLWNVAVSSVQIPTASFALGSSPADRWQKPFHWEKIRAFTFTGDSTPPWYKCQPQSRNKCYRNTECRIFIFFQVFPRLERNFTSEAICSWVFEHRETFLQWLQPPGTKSRLLEQELTKGPALLLFLPHNPLGSNPIVHQVSC